MSERHEERKAVFSIDVKAPKSSKAERIKVEIVPSGFLRSFPDGSQLYNCIFWGGKKLTRYASGLYQEQADGDFYIEVYHHTNAKAAISIRSCSELWSSAWNLEGTQKLENVYYVYFTTLNKIRNESDLRRIAMSTSGEIHMQTTSEPYNQKILKLQVYRESTNKRTSTLKFLVPSSYFAPQHLLFHPPTTNNFAYYECVRPEIMRVGVHSNENLTIESNQIYGQLKKIKHFNNVVLGDASTLFGLEAPFKEETTDQVAILEKLDDNIDLFDFWKENSNTDQVSNRTIEPREFKVDHGL